MTIVNDERYRTCFSKSRYPTHERATEFASKFAAVRGAALRVYPCPFCKGFHTTKQVASAAEAIKPFKTEDTTHRKTFKKPEPRLMRERMPGRWKVLKNPTAWQT